jgi:hypothetical protein
MGKGYITCHAHYEHSFYYYYTYILNVAGIFFVKLNVALLSILQKLKTHGLFNIFLVPNVESIVELHVNGVVRVYFEPDKKVKVTMSPLT